MGIETPFMFCKIFGCQGGVASATISQNSENFGPLLYFELVSSFLDFSLLILAFGFLKRLLEIGLLSIDWFLLI